MISCPKCGKENQDHYKFCLGCGSELARPAAAPTPAAGPHPDSRDPALDRTVLPPAPMGASVAGELRTSSPAVAKARGGIAAPPKGPAVPSAAAVCGPGGGPSPATLAPGARAPPCAGTPAGGVGTNGRGP